MKLNRKQLRVLIESEAKNLDEGILDAAENFAVTTLGHAGIGDAAAFLKASYLDLGRIGKDVMALNDLLSPFGIELNQLGLDTPELDQAIAQFALSDQSIRNNVADLIENLIDNLLKLLVSAVSAFPDVAVSGTISAILSSASTLPTEAIILKGAEYVNKFLELIEKIPGGGIATDFISLSSKITTGPAGFFFGDPMTAFRNLGKLSSATDGQVPAGVELVTAELVAESRWLKMAGVIK